MGASSRREDSSDIASTTRCPPSALMTRIRARSNPVILRVARVRACVTHLLVVSHTLRSQIATRGLHKRCVRTPTILPSSRSGGTGWTSMTQSHWMHSLVESSLPAASGSGRRGDLEGEPGEPGVEIGFFLRGEYGRSARYAGVQGVVTNVRQDSVCVRYGRRYGVWHQHLEDVPIDPDPANPTPGLLSVGTEVEPDTIVGYTGRWDGMLMFEISVKEYRPDDNLVVSIFPLPLLSESYTVPLQSYRGSAADASARRVASALR